MSFWDQLRDGLEEIGSKIADFLPKLVAAVLILLVGWWIARWIRRLAHRLLESSPVKAVLDRAGITGLMENAGYSASALVANIIYFVALLIVFLLAAQALGADTLTTLIQDLIAYLPLVIAGILILVLAGWVGAFLADLVRPWAQQRQMGWIAEAAKYAVLVFGVLTALNVIGVGEISTLTFQIAFGAIGVAFAIAFGVGGIDTAKRWWAKRLAPRE